MSVVVEDLNKPGGKFISPPYDGHGMNEERRVQLLKKVEKGINVFIRIVDGAEREQYGQWLDVLEASPNFVTKTGTIRIYSIDSYIKGKTAIDSALMSRT